jgi:Ca2+-binding EF-hand superfamily protein
MRPSFSASIIGGVSVLLFGMAAGVPGQATRKAPDAADLLALEVILADQNNAQRTMGRHDRNGDDRLDAAEMRELSWPEPPAFFDVNKDGRLTVLEIAMRFAHRRSEAGITKIDQNAAGRFLQRYDKNDDRELDAEEMKAGAWPPDPAQFDADKNGRLSGFEIAYRFARNREERQKRGIEGVDHSYAIMAINVYDHNGDKRLDADEQQMARLPKIADEFDKNGDGLLTIAEIETGLSSDRRQRGVTAVDQKSAQQFVSRYDRNFDGELDAEEMTQGGWPENPGEFDADQDGKLTVQEIATQFAKSKAQRGITDADQQSAERLVLLYDKNNNNLIDIDEVIEAQRPGALAQPRDGQGVSLTILAFVRFDEDHDQRLSKVEMATFLAQRRKELGDPKTTGDGSEPVRE